MDIAGKQIHGRESRTWSRSVLALAGVVLIAGLSGCESDSFLDPSVAGRWEKTPVIMPVLDRLSAIEDQPTEFVQTSPIVPSDLVPEVDQYRLGPGDQLEIRVRDLFVLGVEETLERPIDARGFIDLPRLPSIRLQGRTIGDATTLIENAIRDRKINDRPVVTVRPISQRKQTFSALGGVQTPGTFFIPAPDYRLLEGLTAAGGFDETAPHVFVIRQTPLTDAAAGKVIEPEPVRKSRIGQPPTDAPRAQPTPGEEPKKGEDLIDLIDQLSKPKDPTPGMMGSDAAPAPVRVATSEPPMIDLPDAKGGGSGGGNGQVMQSTGRSQGNGWVFLDGKWVKALPGGGTESVSEQTLVTQRVIKIPTGPLLAGAADVNVVLRPGDVIRVPRARGGTIYVGGQVQRPGAFTLPVDGTRLTLLRALDSAGGLGGLAIPERVDLMRMVGNDRQATIRLDVRAIAEQTQPDIYLKPDDRINVGTNFWAVPLAVIRGGFRASYGFGFILDRNFQGDVFGADRATVREGQ